MERKLAVILQTVYGVIAIALPRSDGEKCEVVKKKSPFLAMRLHRWEKAGKLLLVGGEIDNFEYPMPSEKIYEMKVGRNLELEIVQSESIKPSNHGKPLPYVQSFGNKLFLLHSNLSICCPMLAIHRDVDVPWCSYMHMSEWARDMNMSLFEVFEGDHWRFRPVPFERLLRPDLRFDFYSLSTSVRVPDKWYIIAESSSGIEKSFVFDFIEEKWEQDATVLSQFPEKGLPYPDGEYFLVPGFDENQYTILLAPMKLPGKLEPVLIAYLLDKHHKLLCHQIVHAGIFGELFPTHDLDPNLRSSSAFFIRVGQSQVGGIFFGEISYDCESSVPFIRVGQSQVRRSWFEQIPYALHTHGPSFPPSFSLSQSQAGGQKPESAKLERFLFLSIFSLERHPDFNLPSSDINGVFKGEFLRVTDLKKHKVDNVDIVSPELFGSIFRICGGSFTYL